MSADALLDAGAVLPAGTPVDVDTVDTLTTRSYRHPVLGERVVVRLVPGTLGQAEDLTMEFLGFTAPEEVAEVGLVRQQALGFPAWALVHDPANGHHALALVKEIERLVRIAKSRIGPAKDGFDALGERLARSVPHFLPTFYEEAARAFLAADSPTYAASMFGKARDAERSFALTIDEERQHAVFLEFALAGAITAKALSAHARNLQARTDAATAYDRFRRLCLERVLGGLPPYAAMHTDLRRLAKNAALGADAEDALIRELLAAPAIGRAPGAFWTAYQPALVRVATADPAVRGRLLGIIPSSCPDGVWLELLEATGATAALTAPPGAEPAAAESPDGAAGWLVRFDSHRDRWRRTRLPALLALVERMAARLIADGVPVRLCREHRAFDLDLVDTCLSAGVPLADLPDIIRCDVDRWLGDETEGRRDLAAVAAHPGLVPVLASSAEGRLRNVRGAAAEPDVAKIAELAAVPGIRTALHWWLDDLADRIEACGLATVGAELERFACLACPEGRALNPEAVGRIGAHRLGGVLGRALRAGVFDEFGWPALEAATATLTGGATDPVTLDEHRFQAVLQWPQLVLRADEQVVVVDGDEVALTHFLRIPTDQRSWLWRTVLRYTDGQLLVCWDRGSDRAGYWSGTPDDVFTTDESAFGMWHLQGSLALPGGGRTAGGRPLRAGDHSAEERGSVIGDGTHHWVWDDGQWHELDPATGAVGRASMPAFFTDGAVDGAPLVAALCHLAPAPAGLRDSPLGSHDGLVGWRVRTDGNGRLSGEGVDGRAFSLTLPPRQRPGSIALVGAVRFPGVDTVAGVLRSNAYRDNHVLLRTADGEEFSDVMPGLRPNRFAAGTALVPPVSYWHFLRPRDEAGSATLRAVTDAQARALLSTVEGVDDDALRKLVADAFPGITHPALLTGVTGVVDVAAGITARIDALTTQVLDGSPADATAPVDVEGLPEDLVLNAALTGLIPRCYDNCHHAAFLFREAGPVLAGTSSADVRRELASADEDWFHVLAALPAVLHRAVSPLTPPPWREAILGLLDLIAGSGLIADGARTRRLSLTLDDGTTMPQEGTVLTLGARRVAFVSIRSYQSVVEAVEHAPAGRFGPVPGYTLRNETVLDTHGVTAARVTAFVAAARTHGALPLRPELVRALSEAAGMSLADAAVFLLNPVDLDAWKQHRPEAWVAELGVTDGAMEVAVAARGYRTALVDAYGTLLPEDAETLWADGPRVEALAARWTARHGSRRPVSDELIVDLHNARVAYGISPSELLHGLANASTCGWLAGPVDGADGVDGRSLMRTIVRVIPWLARRLPAGDPVRQALPEVLALVRARLVHPDFTLEVGSTTQEGTAKLLAALGLTATTTDEHGTDAGVIHIGVEGYSRSVRLRPSRLHGPDDPMLAALRAQLGGSGDIAAVRVLLGTHLDSWAAIPEVTTEQDNDPSRSAPALVAEVAARLELSPDAATLYLQLLALPDPTDRNVAAWTGWKPARLKKARAELAATPLVVEAKRPRAGRTLFLPGGWLALKTPHLPLERWKLPLLLADGDAVHELGTVMPIAPVPHLFTLAWARVADGDSPRFEELTTGGRR